MSVITMGRRDTNIWAKEMCLDAIDTWMASDDNYQSADFDDQAAIEKQRNRIAKFLGVKSR